MRSFFFHQAWVGIFVVFQELLVLGCLTTPYQVSRKQSFVEINQRNSTLTCLLFTIKL